MKPDLEAKLNTRLGRTKEVPQSTVRVDMQEAVLRARAEAEHARVMRRVGIHIVIFALSFIFTVGASTLGILLWVDPESLGVLVFVGVVSACIFVASFAGLRMFLLHVLLNDYEPDDDPGLAHHAGKSVAYAVLALILALLLTGLIIQTATAAPGEFVERSARPS